MDLGRSKGITLFEILITISVVAILAAIASPIYFHYIQKAKFSELIQTADRYKVAVSICVERTDINNCDAGKYGIAPAITTAIGLVASTSVIDGVITVTPVATDGFTAADTYILTPNLAGNIVQWTVSGGACASYIPNCTSS